MMLPRASAPSRIFLRSSYTIWRCLFITSSYSTTCLRASKCMPSTFFCAPAMDRATQGCSIGSTSRLSISRPMRSAAGLVVDAPALVALGADDVQPADVCHALSQDDVSPSPSHVGGDRDRRGLARLGDDPRLALVLLGVEHVVLHASPLQHSRQALRLLHRDRTDQHGPLLPVHVDNLFDHGLELRLLTLVNHVRAVESDHLAVGRDGDHVELVDLVELLRLGHRRTGHARELLVLAKVVLDRD